MIDIVFYIIKERSRTIAREGDIRVNIALDHVLLSDGGSTAVEVSKLELSRTDSC